MFGLIGAKLGHSYSKIIHEKLKAYSYELIPLTVEELDRFLKERKFDGLNVTIPYKETVIPYCDYVSPLAQEIGAVNTLYFDPEGRLCGTNTDYIGFLQAAAMAHITFEGKKILILGDGGTCKTILKAVLDSGAKEVIIGSRKISADKKDTFIARGQAISCTTTNYENLSLHRDVEIVINTTPIGMFPNVGGSLIDLRDFPLCSGVFDVVYNPYYTTLLKQAKDLGIPHANGLSMLVAQATEAAKYFTGQDGWSTKNEQIIEELRASL
ncbi:shikimate dehydrogenase family protein [Clostridium aminobutyricum]|uniref:Shikimate dehydrogenase n=1 Tax=Clostridium aminobutyricum TaxID=33953 RepID=A0A939IH45_CLOAM|nr:shikimate dehydrogenase [Clostridium aminobutyricum]MBN7774490.1 shikimate dehydrogenase [Clostridium aminobutyricum]